MHALSKVFRGKFMAALNAAHGNNQIPRPARRGRTLAERQRQLYKHPWVVYAKTPRGPAQVLDYLSRYTHRTAIGNERIKAITPTEVVFSVRADDQGGKRKERLAGPEFIRRFLQHVLPSGIKRIRHYGLLASACKGIKLARAKAALHMPAPQPKPKNRPRPSCAE